MSNRAVDWQKQAVNDLEWARDSFNGGHWAQVCFVCQQIAKKALKAIALSQGAFEIRSHSLVKISEALGINGDIERMGRRDVGVAPNTIKSWVSVLVASGIVRLLEPFFRNAGKRLVKSPMVYWMDTGLAAWFMGLRRKKPLRQSLEKLQELTRPQRLPTRSGMVRSCMISSIRRKYCGSRTAGIWFIKPWC